MRKILFKGARVTLFDASSLHKMAVWSDVSPWCSFVKMRMLLLCVELSPALIIVALVVSRF